MSDWNETIRELAKSEKFDRLETKLRRNFEDVLTNIFGEDWREEPNLKDTPHRVGKMFDRELLAGYRESADEILVTDFPAEDYDQMVVCRDIEFYSLCSHHMLPFYGKAAVGYIPGKGSRPCPNPKNYAEAMKFAVKYEAEAFAEGGPATGYNSEQGDQYLWDRWYERLKEDGIEFGEMITPKVVGLSKLARIVQMFARRLQIQERMTQQIADTLWEFLNPTAVGVYLYDVKHMCMLMRGVKQHESTMETSALLGEFKTDPAARAEFFNLCRAR